MIKNLQYFIGKMCTIFTHPINRNFKEENPKTYPQQEYIYFVGVVEEVDSQGILITQPTTGLKSYFFLQNLIGIAEEEVLDPQDEKHAKIIDYMKSGNAPLREQLKAAEDGPIQIDQMADMLKKAQDQAKK